jgi:MoaA/NifB/PqqE/SkfB family radical SAM enzyme
VSAAQPPRRPPPALATGAEQRAARALIWVRIAQRAVARYRDAVAAAGALRELARLRQMLRGRAPNRKYVKALGRYFWDLNCPGWPSPAFDAFVEAELGRVRPFPDAPATLQTMMLAITKKCALRCEHCSEWDALNGKETLAREDLLAIVGKFQARGVCQVQLSGGEPLRRFDDLLAVLRAGAQRADFWLLTSGHGLDEPRAEALRAAGLTGVQISLDHWDPGAHDRFRGTSGSFAWVVRAAAAARGADLAVCFNLCATRAFVGAENLARYARLCARLGGGFIQLLEPRAVGHYRGADVDLRPDQEAELERFFLSLNHDAASDGLPLCTYHAFGQRRVGCFSAGDRFLFVDTDGRAHACPFCQAPAADCRSASADEALAAVRGIGCQKYAPVAYGRLPVRKEAGGG